MKQNRKLKLGKLIFLLSAFYSQLCLAQTHTMSGTNNVPSGASLILQSGSTTDFNAGATVDFTGATVTGLAAGGGNVSNSGTPTVGQKALWVDSTHIQGVTDNSLQWDGGSTNLVAATARTSLSLVPGTNVEVPLTFSTGLTRSTNTVTVNTSQNIATLSNLTTNGFVKTGGAVGTLSVDTATYQGTLTNSSGLRGALSDENGTGAALFSGATTPDFTTGFTIGAAAASGKIPIGNGTNYVPSTPTYPNAAGTAGYTVRSDGTNFASYPQDMLNSSTSTDATFSAADKVLQGSLVTVAAGDFKTKGQYHCVFDMVKSAGTGAIVITLRVGTLGTTSDAAIQTFTFGTGTSVADTARFEVWAVFRTVGSGTSAVVQGVCHGAHNLATTGMFNNADQWTVIGSPSPSSGFATNTATVIHVTFNGSTSFSGTNTIVQATLVQ